MKTQPQWAAKALAVAIVAAFALASGPTLRAQTQGPIDPGVRGGAPGAGAPLSKLTSDETAFFQDGSVRFGEVEVVAGGANNGLGPRFNSNQCFSCHSQPAMGGTSPAHNPLPAVAALSGAKNTVPWFITASGPVREARFKKSPDGTNDGEVHDLFVIAGRTDAPGCNIAQPDFTPAGNGFLSTVRCCSEWTLYWLMPVISDDRPLEQTGALEKHAS